jgi:hypothetical protein
LLSFGPIAVAAFVLWKISDSGPQFVVWLLGFLFVYLLTFIVWHFTKPLPGVEVSAAGQSGAVEPWLKPENARMKRYWMTLSYCFMILALAAAVVPFAIDLRKDPSHSDWAIEHYARADSPISVFRGCVADPRYSSSPLYCNGDEASGAAIPEFPRLSWIVQIGGYVTPFPFDPESITKYDQKERQLLQVIKVSESVLEEVLEGTSLEQLRAYGKATQEALAKQETATEDAKQRLAQLVTSPQPTQPEAAAAHNDNIAEAEEELETANVVIELLRTRADQLAENEQIAAQNTAAKKQALHELKRLVYSRDRFDRGDAGYSVEGGLVVPFHLIVLSLVGGAVSLTRRIPEYQKQSAPGYVGTKDAPVLTPAELREYLVFQIVQFISAPFIAAVAYYVLAPATTAMTVGLAFAAGFASETVLLWIRAVVDKLRPEGVADPLKGSLAGTISSLTNMATEEETRQGASVAIIGRDELIPTYGPNGQFAINGIPEGEYALKVTLANKKVCTQSVRIQAGRTLPVWVECP